MTETFIQGMVAGSMLGVIATAISTKLMFNQFPWEVDHDW